LRLRPRTQQMYVYFEECWKTKKKAVHFNLPPPDYSVEVEGTWTFSARALLLAGEYLNKGPGMVQLKKCKGAEKSVLNIEIDPWTRHEALALERQERFEEKPREESEAFVPQVALKAVRIWECY